MFGTFQKFLMATALTAAVACAQPAGSPPAPETTDIQAYLGLSDAQVQTLLQARQTENQQLQALQQQIGDKQKAISDALAKGGASAQTLGQLMLDIDSLHKQIQAKDAQFRDQALAALNLSADQKKKLTALDDARKLRPAIEQATILNLLAPPENAAGPGERPRMAGPGGPGALGPMGFRRGGRPPLQ